MPFGFVAGHLAIAQQPATQTQSSSQPPAAAQQTPAPAASTPPVAELQPGEFIGGQGVSITYREWLGEGHPVMGTGHGNTNPYPSSLDFGGRPRPAESAILSVPLGKKQHHTLRFSYFRVQGFGNPTAPQNLILYGTEYYAGDYMATHYTMQNAKVSLDYLSWPFPVKDSKLRVKTLWEVQTVTFQGGLDAPLRHGTTDASGNPIETVAAGLDWFVFPSFGLGLDYLMTHNLRFEGRASGFLFPHRSTIYDLEASLNYRLGKFEIEGGLKTFHFKTSPERTEFVQATLPGVFVGLRWYPNYSSR